MKHFFITLAFIVAVSGLFIGPVMILPYFPLGLSYQSPTKRMIAEILAACAIPVLILSAVGCFIFFSGMRDRRTDVSTDPFAFACLVLAFPLFSCMTFGVTPFISMSLGLIALWRIRVLEIHRGAKWAILGIELNLFILLMAATSILFLGP